VALNFKGALKVADTTNNRPHIVVYVFFLVHMFAFGGSGFYLAYGEDTPYIMTLMHGSIAIFVYIIFYITLFGLDKVVWMFINAILGLAQTYFVINFLGQFFVNNWDFYNYPFYRHIIPAIYIVLYLFLIRQLIYDIIKNEKITNFIFIFINIIMYLYFYIGSL